MAAKSYLFTVTHWALTVGTMLMMLFMLLMVVAEGGLAVALFNMDGDHLGIPADIAGLSRDTILVAGVPVIAGLAAGALILALIFHLTAKIVETAISGDPFAAQNAIRLTRIGWLLLTLEIGGWAMQLALAPLLHRIHDNVDWDFDPSPVGILAILLVFVLAQVFRRGSEMRAELEATV
jgi:hypothetical protein